MTALIEQTAEMRKPEEQREEEHQREKLDQFIERNQHRSIKLKDDGDREQSINLSQFAQYKQLAKLQ